MLKIHYILSDSIDAAFSKKGGFMQTSIVSPIFYAKSNKGKVKRKRKIKSI